LAQLVVNLTRGARFHTTQGTPLSSYLRCERLIEQLLSNLQPQRRAGEPVGPGRNDWILERFLGMGAFGEVWLGRSRRHPEPRAFKFCTLPQARDWLEREGEALYQVQSRLADCPNVIRYLDIALDGTPFPYLVLEYVGGGSLEDWILAAPADRAVLNVAELMAGIARGLADAHQHHIFHRDLKPANVLLTAGADPDPKIADFGLSRVEPERAEGSSASQSKAVIVGTRMYLPPEAADVYAKRSPAKDDVFALGIVWYQLLINKIERPPYDFAEQLRSKGVDARTLHLLTRCLAQPERRFRDAFEVLKELEQEVAPVVWDVPEGCFDVGPLAREYVANLAR
jgi:serine/threonine protein kinase